MAATGGDDSPESSLTYPKQPILDSRRRHLHYKKFTRTHYQRSIGTHIERTPFKQADQQGLAIRKPEIKVRKQWQNGFNFFKQKIIFKFEKHRHGLFLKYKEANCFRRIMFEFTKKLSTEKASKLNCKKKEKFPEKKKQEQTGNRCCFIYVYLGTLYNDERG